jgi:hypothetical protein
MNFTKKLKKKEKTKNNSFFLHNLIGHPIMALCRLFGLHSQARIVHDWTLPSNDSSRGIKGYQLLLNDNIKN